MEPNELTRFYDTLKSEVDIKNKIPPAAAGFVGDPIRNANGLTPAAVAWKNCAMKQCDKLKERCRKHIILDIYCRILPLDDDYKCGAKGIMKDDVDKMLANKGMTATQYLTSAANETKAPLLEYVLRSTDLIGKQFMEEAEKELKDAEDANVTPPPPEAPDEDDEMVQSQLVDLKSDDEYETFVDALKKKTIDKIVADVTEVINKGKEENDMKLDPKPNNGVDTTAVESAVSVGLDYIQKRLITEGVEVDPEMREDMIGAAIREATLNQLDSVFRLPGSDLRSFSTKIRLGKGVVINEACCAKYCKKENASDKDIENAEVEEEKCEKCEKSN